MTRFVDPAEFAAKVRDSDLEGADGLADALMGGGERLIAFESARRQDLLPTYEVRLSRARLGEGPRATGLEQFVGQLRSDGDIEMFAFSDEDHSWVGLVDLADHLIALVMVLRESGAEP